ncbi:MAG: proton-conducting transporter membrane subunit, partial [Bdellovibrionales bacterium]|nr:proton-conducting transporter membrane subunit [Bdellovibrionales bacterium]
MESLIVFPLVIPLLTGIILIFLWNLPSIQRWVAQLSSFIHLGTCLYLLNYVTQSKAIVLTMGSWPAPFGITFVLDTFSALMLSISSIVAFCTNIFAHKMESERKFQLGFYPFVQFLIMGVSGAFLTGDLFNLYVWYEVMLISSFILLALGGNALQLGSSLKYTIINLKSSLLFLTALGLIYGKLGTLNMADIAQKLISLSALTPEIQSSFVLLFIAFAIKSAVFPLFFWLPLSYPYTSYSISAIFAGLLTKVGVYSLIRCITLFFGHEFQWIQGPLIIIACLTMVIGVFGATSRSGMREILSFHIVSQIGYMILGLGLFGVFGVAWSIFYMFHHIAVKTNLFFAAGVVKYLRGNDRLSSMGDIYRDYPFFSLLFLIPAFSLAGVPPLSGFFAKYGILYKALDSQYYWPAAICLFVGLLTLYSMIKIWSEGFWKKSSKKMHHKDLKTIKIPFSLFAPMLILAI